MGPNSLLFLDLSVVVLCSQSFMFLRQPKTQGLVPLYSTDSNGHK